MTRFLAVVGTSGSGKSSLVRSGLIPALQSGFMVGASSSWRIAVFRPGEDPICHLAQSTGAPGVLGDHAFGDDAELAATSGVLVEATLRRGPRGLADAVRQARLPKDENVLILVDQFEELFRFRGNRQIANSRDDAVLFVRLLLEATAQQTAPVYVVLTMRSDFIGDCMDFPGLPEAVNTGLFLVGRMSRDALRAAMTGPVAVGGGTIEARLVTRILNDLGDDHDQLPLVQHALMRTWDQWQQRVANTVVDSGIDIEDYEAVGTFRNALSQHAEDAFAEASAAGAATIVERVFKALTDTFSDPRGVRRPTSVADLASIAEVPEAEIIRVVEIFRRPGRSFLMPPAAVPLTSTSFIDLSHESLMRCWTRLIAWAEEERASAEFYVRLSKAAAWFEEGKAGLWRNPELELAQQWRAASHPTAAWAARYDAQFTRSMEFLDKSLLERDAEIAERRRQRRATLRRVQVTAAVLATLLLITGWFAYVARRERLSAERNLALARTAVDESLSSAERDPARISADVPQLEEFRNELLSKAEKFYVTFLQQEPTDEQSRADLAAAHLRLGHINRMQMKRDAAVREYQDAISRFDALAQGSPSRGDYKRSLANAYNWLGETWRPDALHASDAQRGYDRAFEIQSALVKASPRDAELQEELARTHYNRGILIAQTDPARADADFREAVRLLEPIEQTSDRAAQELARAYNNLASVHADDAARVAEVRQLWERAIAIDEKLVAGDPINRGYQLELAKFYDNLAWLLHGQGDAAGADRRSRQAIALLTMLSRLPPTLAVERADAHNLRAMMRETASATEAQAEYDEAVSLFEELQNDAALRAMPDFHQRFGDLLLNLASFSRGRKSDPAAAALLTRAVAAYAAIVDRTIGAGTPSDARLAVDTLTRVEPDLPEQERRRLAPLLEQLRLEANDAARRQ